MPNLPTGHTQVTKTGNFVSVDVYGASHLYTFGPRGRVMHREGREWPQKIGKANGMPSLPIMPTKVSSRGYVGSLDPPRAAHLSTFGPRGQGNAL